MKNLKIKLLYPTLITYKEKKVMMINLSTLTELYISRQRKQRMFSVSFLGLGFIVTYNVK